MLKSQREYSKKVGLLMGIFSRHADLAIVLVIEAGLQWLATTKRSLDG